MRFSSLGGRLTIGMLVVVLLVAAAWNGQPSRAQSAATPAATESAGSGQSNCAVPAGMTPATAPADMSSVEAGDFKVGVGIALSGAAKAYGETQRKGLLLALDEINKAGGVDGKKIALLIRDTATDKTQAATVFQNLIQNDKVFAMLGPTLSQEAAAAHVVSQDAGIPTVTMSNTGFGITDGKPFIFRDSLSEADAIPHTVDVMKNKLNIKAVAVMYAQDDKFSSDSYQVFKTELEKAGITTIDTEVFNTADTDFSAYLTKIQGLNPPPDAIVVSALLGPAAKIIVKARELGLNQQIVGGNGFNTPLIIAATQGKAEGAVFGGAWSCSSNDPVNVAFVKAYIARWGQAPDQFAAQSYTALKIVADAIHRAKTTTDEKALRDALAATKDLPTPLGPFSFDENRNAKQATFVQTIKGGQFVLLGQ